MANEQNLVSLATRPERERKEIARMGQKASTEVKKQKATMKETLKQMLEEVADIEGNDSKLTYRQLATLGLIKGSIQGKADNYKTILEAIGELTNEVKLTPEININVVNNEDLEKAMYEKE